MGINIEQLQALDILMRLPDSAALTVDEAAVVLRLSPSTLNKMRMPSHPTKGPVFIQADGSGPNQKVVYLKADLLNWQNQNRIANTHEAAKRKGHLFASLHELAEPVPFWCNPVGKIAGLVEKTEINTFIERLSHWTIEWMDPLEAMSASWESLTAMEQHADDFDKQIGAMRSTVRSALEQAKLSA